MQTVVERQQIALIHNRTKMCHFLIGPAKSRKPADFRDKIREKRPRLPGALPRKTIRIRQFSTDFPSFLPGGSEKSTPFLGHGLTSRPAGRYITSYASPRVPSPYRRRTSGCHGSRRPRPNHEPQPFRDAGSRQPRDSDPGASPDGTGRAGRRSDQRPSCAGGTASAGAAPHDVLVSRILRPEQRSAAGEIVGGSGNDTRPVGGRPRSSDAVRPSRNALRALRAQRPTFNAEL